MSVKTALRRATAVLRSNKKVAIPAIEVDSGRPGPVFFVTAAQHGMEVQGSEAIRRFISLAERRITAGKVVGIPFMNLPAVELRHPHINHSGERPYSDDRGHNMNRLWPGKRNGNDTERVCYAINRTFLREATHVLDIHCWARFTAPALIIRDEPHLRRLAIKISPLFVNVVSPRPLTLGGMFCDSGRTGLTYECSGQYTVDRGQVEECTRIITNMAKAIGVLPGKPVSVYGETLFSDVSDSLAVKAPCSGLFVEADLEICMHVDKGALLGHILTSRNLEARKILSPRKGFLRSYGAFQKNCDVFLSAHHPYVRRGEKLAVLNTQKQ